MALYFRLPLGETVALPKSLLTETLPKAPAQSVKALLCAWGLFGNAAVDVPALAKALNFTAAETEAALAYWQTTGLLVEEAPAPCGEKPSYRPEELAYYVEHSPQVKALFNHTSRLLGNLLKHSDMETVFSFYDCLHLPLEVIDCLITYCEEKNIRSLAYMEKVAIAWAEQGIDTQEKALAQTEAYTTGHREVVRAFGISGRALTPPEEAFLRKWRLDWQLPLPLVRLACEKTVLQTGKGSFPYADKILSRWHEAGAQTEADVAALDAKRSPAQKPTPAPKPNKFTNFDQRELDFDALAQRKRRAMEQRQGGAQHDD